MKLSGLVWLVVLLLAVGNVTACSDATNPDEPGLGDGNDGGDGNGNNDGDGDDDGDGDGDGDGDPPPFTLATEIVASGLNSPIYLTAPASDSRLFVVEQAGRVLIIENGQLLSTPFLDITDRVQSGGELGLFSVAFHPDYASNGFFYVNYTQSPDRATRIERYSVTADPNVADPDSDVELLTIAQPFTNHNGGLNAFGLDGMLYIGMGDGGSQNDPDGQGQNINTLLGALLRLDVDGGDPFAIPADNPFVGVAGADEIWAIGLRNPWRFAFDRQTNDLYIADVGQDAWEEINIASSTAAPINYGWNTMEGMECFGAASCDMSGLTLPALAYGHAEGCSVTGGYVYRGAALPELDGHYFYSDWCSGFLRSFVYTGTGVSEETEWEVGDLGNVVSFGEDADGELYIVSGNGNIYRLTRGE